MRGILMGSTPVLRNQGETLTLQVPLWKANEATLFFRATLAVRRFDPATWAPRPKQDYLPDVAPKPLSASATGLSCPLECDRCDGLELGFPPVIRLHDATIM